MVEGAGDAFQQQGEALGQGAWALKVSASGANRAGRGGAAQGQKEGTMLASGQAGWLNGGCPRPLASSEQALSSGLRLTSGMEFLFLLAAPPLRQRQSTCLKQKQVSKQDSRQAYEAMLG